jgi:hypothetical protein
MADVVTLFRTFRDTLFQQLESHQQSLSPDAQQVVRRALDGLGTVSAAGVEGALRAFFDHPPSHVTAVNSLDHSLFVTPIAFPGCSFPLREVLTAFSKIPMAYGSLWLGLLDVAQAANPGQIQSAPGRAFIQQQMVGGAMATTSTDPPPIGGLNPSQLEGMLCSVLGAFPRVSPVIGRVR